MPVKTAVVILNWNGKTLLEKFLPGVVNLSLDDADIYVADNCSSDGSVEFIKKNFPQVRLIINDKNYGFAGGYNICLKEIDAPYYILLNSDIEVTEGWIKPVISMMESDPTIAAAQPKIRAFGQRDYFEYAGASGGYIDHYGYPFCRGRIFNSLEKDEAQYNHAEQVFWASGACLFVRAEAFKLVNGFDETFFAHMEEIDLCWRLQRYGFKIMVQPASTVYHVGGGTLAKSNPRKTYLNFRNNLLMLHKNLPGSRLFSVILYRLFLDGIAAVKFLFSDSPADFTAVLKAHFYFYRHFISRLAIRKNAKPKSKDYSVSGVYCRNLVFEYFIRHKKKFTDLDKSKFI